MSEMAEMETTSNDSGERDFKLKCDADYDGITIQHSRLVTLRDGGHLCDVVLHIKDAQDQTVDFAAHKIVLVAASPFFHYLYASDQLSDVVDLPSDFRPLPFSIMLDVIYGKLLTFDEVRTKSDQVHNLLEELRALAAFLELSDVALHLERWIQDPPLTWSSFLDDVKYGNVSVKEEPDAEKAGISDNESSCKRARKRTSKRKSWTEKGHKVAKRKSLPTNFDVDTVDEDLDLFDSPEHLSPESLHSVPETEETLDVPKPSSRVIDCVPIVMSHESKKLASSKTVTCAPEPVTNSIPPIDDSQARNAISHTVVSNGNGTGRAENGDLMNSEHLSKFKALSQDEIKDMFKNPRDQVYIGKQRLLNNVDRVQGSMNSWYRAKDSEESFIGKVIPYGNRSSRTNKIWNDIKRVAGEVRGENVQAQLELKLADGNIQTGIRCRRGVNRLQCPFCDLKIVRTSKSAMTFQLGAHFLSDHNYVWIDIALVCDLCNFINFSIDSVRDHLNMFHNIARKAPEGSAILCQLCGNTFASKKRLRVHKTVCSESASKDGKDDKPKKVYKQSHVCGTCGKSCLSSQILENHLCKEHGAPYRFYCNQEGCNVGVNSRCFLIEHLFSAHKINAGTNPILKCSFCDYYTLRKTLLRKHELSHTSVEYSFKCTHEGCDKSFRQVRHLKKHMEQFHVDLKLPCPYCSSVFATKLKLRRHERVMHTERVRNFKCAYCNHATVSRENCRTHVKRSHKDEPVIVIDLKKSGLPPLPL